MIELKRKIGNVEKRKNKSMEWEYLIEPVKFIYETGQFRRDFIKLKHERNIEVYYVGMYDFNDIYLLIFRQKIDVSN
jgi:hypothetical protein